MCNYIVAEIIGRATMKGFSKTMLLQNSTNFMGTVRIIFRYPSDFSEIIFIFSRILDLTVGVKNFVIFKIT